jgi:hypothetical protein
MLVYLDAWLNGCVAIERTINASKGINFDKKKSRRVARLIIIILAIFIMGTIIHEPLHRDLFQYTTERYQSGQDVNRINESMEYENWTNKTTGSRYLIENYVICVISYSRSVEYYNTVILFFHLIVPFIANLFSAFYIIFGTAHRRTTTRTRKTFKEQVFEQLSVHKQLVISPMILLLLSLPRLIFSLVSGCVNSSDNLWLYLFAYLISFTPSMLIFVVFVLPSQLYMKTLKESLTKCIRWAHRI